jgi:hypothetical protein
MVRALRWSSCLIRAPVLVNAHILYHYTLGLNRLAVPWTHTCPRGEAAIGREVAHVCPDSGRQRFGHAGVSPRDGVEEIDRLGQKQVGTLLQVALNLHGRAGHCRIELVVLAS